MKLSDEARQAKNAYQREYNRTMSDEAKRAKNAYQREYRRKNPDKFKQYNADYWERKAGRINTGTMEYEIFRLHNAGLSLREIAAKIGINHVKVSRILKSL